MRVEVAAAMSKSSQDFLSIAWPAIGKPFGEIIPVESVTANSFAKELDTRAGIDQWLVGVDGNMRGLASRVQWTDSSYDTFTIRVRARFGGPTEYDKRKREIAAAGAITPYYVCQAYVSKDRSRLVAAAIARMRDVIAAMDLGMGGLMPPNGDGTQGHAVPWAQLRLSGAPLHVWHSQEGLW